MGREAECEPLGQMPYTAAANVVAIHRVSHPQQHVSKFSDRVIQRKRHQKVIRVIARYLAEVKHWVFKKEAIL